MEKMFLKEKIKIYNIETVIENYIEVTKEVVTFEGFAKVKGIKGSRMLIYRNNAPKWKEPKEFIIRKFKSLKLNTDSKIEYNSKKYTVTSIEDLYGDDRYLIILGESLV